MLINRNVIEKFLKCLINKRLNNILTKNRVNYAQVLVKRALTMCFLKVLIMFLKNVNMAVFIKTGKFVYV